MADSKITELTEVTSLANDDLFIVVDQSEVPPTTKKVQVQNALNKVVNWVQYSNSTKQSSTSLVGSYTKASFATDRDSLAGTNFTLVSATDFRTDFNGYVKITYNCDLQNETTNDRPGECVIVKNSVALDFTSRQALGKNNTDRHSSVCFTGIFACVSGDIWSLGVRNSEAGLTDSIAIPAERGFFKLEVERLA